MAELDAVTFDFWNTLCYEEVGHLRGLRLAAWAGILESRGFAVERELLDATFERSWQTFGDRWTKNEQFLAADGAVAIIEELGVDVPADVRDELVDAFTSVGETADLHLTPNVAGCLRALKDAGLKLGIICDVGMTPSSILRRHLDRHGVLELFDHWSFSDEVGVYKPHPAIFDHALGGLGVEPGRAAHVGDLRRTDVAGALAKGMTAVRYTGLFDDTEHPEPEAHLVLDDHAELPAALLGR
jgi:putative hydrolase of the HAD superfamily